MVFHMKTTLVIDDGVMRRLKATAAHRSTTISALVEAALRRFLDAPEADSDELSPLPTWDFGGALVDVDDREALYEVLDSDRNAAYSG